NLVNLVNLVILVSVQTAVESPLKGGLEATAPRCVCADSMGKRNLNRLLLIFKALTLWSRVDGGIPSLAAAPDNPETRPLLSASAASMISRSLRGSLRGEAAGPA